MTYCTMIGFRGQTAFGGFILSPGVVFRRGRPRKVRPGAGN